VSSALRSDLRNDLRNDLVLIISFDRCLMFPHNRSHIILVWIVTRNPPSAATESPPRALYSHYRNHTEVARILRRGAGEMRLALLSSTLTFCFVYHYVRSVAVSVATCKRDHIAVVITRTVTTVVAKR